MFPVNDFNFVVAGIATFAATVGYACTRKLGASLYDLLSAMSQMPNQFCDVRSGPGLERVQEKSSADSEASSSDLDDIIISEDQDITTSILSSQESLKRKVPDDGFDEANVRIFTSVILLLRNLAVLL
jgi:hypothetical protein